MASFIPRKGPAGKRVWQAHVRRRGYPAQVKTFDAKADAEAWARRIEEEIDRAVFAFRIEVETTTLFTRTEESFGIGVIVTHPGAAKGRGDA